MKFIYESLKTSVRCFVPTAVSFRSHFRLSDVVESSCAIPFGISAIPADRLKADFCDWDCGMQSVLDSKKRIFDHASV